jgi:hypothetical protein
VPGVAVAVAVAVAVGALLLSDQPILQEFMMNKSSSWPIAVIAGLLIAAPAFAQTQDQSGQTGNPKTVQHTNLPATVHHSHYATGAQKQKTQAELPEVGPASQAYYGNTQRSKY